MTVQNSQKAFQPDLWRGPQGWEGRALPDYRAFAFHDLPWRLEKCGGSLTPGAACVKRSRSRMVLRIEASGSERLYAKRYLVNNWRRRMGNRLAGSKAEREFHLGLDLIKAGLPTPTPLACARHREPFSHDPANGGTPTTLPPASYLLTREWPNEGSIQSWIKAFEGDRDRFWVGVARFIARGHDRGFYHDDLSAEHVLIAPGLDLKSGSTESDADSPFAYIDIDNGKLGGEPVAPRRRAINLFQILRSIGFGAMPPKARRSFIEEYLRASKLDREISLEACISAIEKVARRKIGRSVVTRKT